VESLKKYSILNSLFFVLNFGFSKFVEEFRMNTNLRWVYEYGKTTSLLLFIVIIVFSFVIPILIIKETNQKVKIKILWILIASIPFLYFGIIMRTLN
jgi:hypothetical protein